MQSCQQLFNLFVALLYIVRLVIPSSKYSSLPTVVVLGGGHSGVGAATQICNAMHGKCRLLLVDRKEQFVFVPLIYDYLVDALEVDEIVQPYSEIASRKNFEYVSDTVVNIDCQSKKCILNEKGDVPYDFLVIALGTVARSLNIDGFQQNAYPFYTMEQADILKIKLNELLKSDEISMKGVQIGILGGGYVGVELAATLHNTYPFINIAIIDREASILQAAPKYLQDTVRRMFQSPRVKVIPNASVVKISEDSLVYQEKGCDDMKSLMVDLVITTVGTESHPVIKEANIMKNHANKIMVTSCLQSVQYEDVFAVGDCSVISPSSMTSNPSLSSRPLPTTAQVASQQSATLAANVIIKVEEWHSSKDNKLKVSKPLQPFRYFHMADFLMMGQWSVAFELFKVLRLRGAVVALIRRIVYAIKMPNPLWRVIGKTIHGAFLYVLSGLFWSSHPIKRHH